MQARFWMVLGCLLLALVGYYLPWYTHDTAGFTMNGFDLSEWTSIHPAVRSSSPPMLTSFLLRLPQLALVAALALVANEAGDVRVRWLVRGGALLLALRSFPPTDFFSTMRDDPNYRQMALLAVLGVAAVAVAPLAPGRRWQRALLAAVLAVGAMAGWAGLQRADELLDNFEIAVQVGPGAPVYTLAAALATVLVLVRPPTKKAINQSQSPHDGARIAL